MLVDFECGEFYAVLSQRFVLLIHASVLLVEALEHGLLVGFEGSEFYAVILQCVAVLFQRGVLPVEACVLPVHADALPVGAGVLAVEALEHGLLVGFESGEGTPCAQVVGEFRLFPLDLWLGFGRHFGCSVNQGWLRALGWLVSCLRSGFRVAVANRRLGVGGACLPIGF